eukprot:scaffold7133_cov147-Isochrysis_galbana.AAC.3
MQRRAPCCVARVDVRPPADEQPDHLGVSFGVGRAIGCAVERRRPAAVPGLHVRPSLQELRHDVRMTGPHREHKRRPLALCPALQRDGIGQQRCHRPGGAPDSLHVQRSERSYTAVGVIGSGQLTEHRLLPDGSSWWCCCGRVQPHGASGVRGDAGLEVESQPLNQPRTGGVLEGKLSVGNQIVSVLPAARPQLHLHGRPHTCRQRKAEHLLCESRVCRGGRRVLHVLAAVVEKSALEVRDSRRVGSGHVEAPQPGEQQLGSASLTLNRICPGVELADMRAACALRKWASDQTRADDASWERLRLRGRLGPE